MDLELSIAHERAYVWRGHAYADTRPVIKNFGYFS